MKEPRAPTNLPSVGDRCKLRGRNAAGTLREVTPHNNWARVDWDDPNRGPVICHLYELEKAVPMATG